MKLFPSQKPDDIRPYMILNQAVQSLADKAGIKYTLPKSTDELKDAYLAVAKILKEIEYKIDLSTLVFKNDEALVDAVIVTLYGHPDTAKTLEKKIQAVLRYHSNKNEKEDKVNGNS